MVKPASQILPLRFRLVSVTVERPKSKKRYATLSEALEDIRPWVGFGEAVRIFNKVFLLGGEK